MIVLIFTVIVASSVWLLCFALSNPSSRFYVMDNPNERSLHSEPKPRVGGVAIVSSIFAAWVIILITQDIILFNYYYVLVGLIILFMISYLDDHYSISQILRLIVHIIAAILLIISGIGLSETSLHIDELVGFNIAFNALTILAIVWCVNLYNFMDGIDGLAGGMGFIGFGCFAWFGWFAGDSLFLLMAGIVAAANFGFLLHNFPPAKIFMGDVGSISMGYLLAFFSLWGIYAKIFAWWMPILVFSPFIVDASVTLIKRLFRREKFWIAHKSHHYQILVQIGWGQKKTIIYEYFLMIAISCTAIVIQVMGSGSLTIYMLVIWSSIYILIISVISYLSARSGVF